MDHEQTYQVRKATQEVAAIRRTIEELEGFGWKVSETNKPLKSFDAALKALQTLPPASAYLKSEIAARLNDEKTLIESLVSLAREARAALTDEELSLFNARDKYLTGFDAQIQQADEENQQALEGVLQALQNRWNIMQKKHELAQRLSGISEKHNTPESFGAGDMRIGKPFAKLHSAIWHAFLKSYFERVQELFTGAETAAPADVARSVFEK
jgi:uncharacterized phage infection (PIP) family protein YhgE